MKIRKAINKNFEVAIIAGDANDISTLVNNAFADKTHDARISTSYGVKIEQNKLVGPVSTIMRLVTQKDGHIYIFWYNWRGWGWIY